MAGSNLYVLLVCFLPLLAVVTGQSFPAESCKVIHKPKHEVKCVKPYPIAACNGGDGCSHVANPQDCLFDICCCSPGPHTADSPVASEAAPPPKEAPVHSGEKAHVPAAGPAKAPKASAHRTPKAPSKPIDCVANVTADYTWKDSAGYHNTVRVTLLNKGTKAVQVPYNVTITNPGFASLIQYWNWVAEVKPKGTVHGIFNFGHWQDLQAKGNTTSLFGMVVTSTESNFKPTSVALNGHKCSII